jgi:hypothetical protein
VRCGQISARRRSNTNCGRQDFFVAEADYADAARGKHQGAFGVLLLLDFMDFSVQLDGEFARGAVEVQDEAAGRVLAADGDAAQALVPHLFPEHPLRRCGFQPHAARRLQDPWYPPARVPALHIQPPRRNPAKQAPE